MFIIHLLVPLSCLFSCILLTASNRTTGLIHYYEWSPNNNTFIAVPTLIDLTSKSLQPDFIPQNATALVQQAFVSASQCRQDLTVFEILNKKQGGYYIDLAANEWMKISNTYGLDVSANWTGLCIEPMPEYTQGILANRRCKLVRNPVFSQSNHHVKFKSQNVFSGIVQQDMDNKVSSSSDLHLITTTLMAVLNYFQAPRVIDYLSLDVEGAEFHVLKHFDFGMYIFSIMTVERPTEEFHRLLAKHGYWFAMSLRDKHWSYFGECLYLHVIDMYLYFCIGVNHYTVNTLTATFITLAECTVFCCVRNH